MAEDDNNVVLAALNEISNTTNKNGTLVMALEPTFLDPLENLTVVQGKDATFRCTVNNLGGYRVAWLKTDSKAILAIHDHVITSNGRLRAEHNDLNTWTLTIRGVRPTDRGEYMCQINTEPMKVQTAYLDVVVPPDILDHNVSGDIMVPEGASAKLYCKADGYPKPKIIWRREDGEEIVIREAGVGGSVDRLPDVEGETLLLGKVTRSEMGAYLCIANNSIPPIVSRRMMLYVHFSPQVNVVNQLVGAPVGTDVTLKCHVESSPRAVHYWTRDNGDLIIQSDKYDPREELKSYRVIMTLVIRSIRNNDFGSYRCVAKNSIAEAEGTVRLYEMRNGVVATYDNRENYTADKEKNNKFEEEEALEDRIKALINETRIFAKSNANVGLSLGVRMELIITVLLLTLVSLEFY